MAWATKDKKCVCGCNEEVGLGMAKVLTGGARTSTSIGDTPCSLSGGQTTVTTGSSSTAQPLARQGSVLLSILDCTGQQDRHHLNTTNAAAGVGAAAEASPNMGGTAAGGGMASPPPSPPPTEGARTGVPGAGAAAAAPPPPLRKGESWTSAAPLARTLSSHSPADRPLPFACTTHHNGTQSTTPPKYTSA